MRKLPRIKMIRRDNWSIDTCRGKKKVLHVGCTNSPITAEKIASRELIHFKLAEVADRIIGLDIDREGIEILLELMPNRTFILHSAEELNILSPIFWLSGGRVCDEVAIEIGTDEFELGKNIPSSIRSEVI